MDFAHAVIRPPDVRLCGTDGVPDAPASPFNFLCFNATNDSRGRSSPPPFQPVGVFHQHTSPPPFPKMQKDMLSLCLKKVARLSVTRHRIKRRVLAALRARPSPLPPSLVLYPRPSVLNMSYDALQKELTKLLS